MNDFDFFKYEYAAWESGSIIAGADEAGRGPLAGPVVAAAVILPKGCIIEGITDSKKLSAKKRDQLYLEITKNADFAVGIVEPDVIDEINILNAARLAFKQAVSGLKTTPEFVYADYITGLDLNMPHLPIVKGDLTVYSIAAASIIAKVTRDRIMDEYDSAYPIYGFKKHKGYGTKQHREALIEHGPCEIHRRTFLKKILPDYAF